jgi:hypothetical protein
MVVQLLLAATLVLGQTGETITPAGEKSEKLDERVKVLVRQLDHNEQAKREAAEKDLIALGSDVLPLLPPVNNRTPAEVRNRLTRIRSALTKAAIEATTKSTPVTLSGEMPVSQAMAELAKQSGNELVDYRDRFNQEARDPAIKVELKEVPFWEALDTVLDAAGLSLYNFDEERSALAYVARGDDASPRVGKATYSGLFRLEPARVEATRDLKTGMRSARLTVDVAWEPRVRPIVLEQPLDETSATDEAGNPLPIDGREGKLEVPVEVTNSAIELEIPLQAPERSVKQIGTLKGKLTAVVLGRVESFEFADLDKLRGAELERGGATVVVDSCRKNGDIYEVNMRVAFDKANNALESHRGWIYNNECFVTDGQKNRIDNVGVEATLLGDNEVGLSYKFDLGEEPKVAEYAFIYRTAAAIIRVPVEFELSKIDLP